MLVFKALLQPALTQNDIVNALDPVKLNVSSVSVKVIAFDTPVVIVFETAFVSVKLKNRDYISKVWRNL